GWSTIERGARLAPERRARPTEVTKKQAARIAVVRVRRFAVERPVMKPDMPPPPMPSPPPSLFCRRTTPTSATAMSRWTTRTTVIMGQDGNWREAGRYVATRPVECQHLKLSAVRCRPRSVRTLATWRWEFGRGDDGEAQGGDLGEGGDPALRPRRRARRG